MQCSAMSPVEPSCTLSVFWLLLLLLLATNCQASYRLVSLASPDLCLSSHTSLALSPKETKTLVLERSTAAVLKLESSSGILPFQRCDLKIKSSNKQGLMVRVERGELRQSDRKKCLDYIQFGRDDNMPFFTWDKTAKLCGNFSSFHYSDNNGELLIWLRLGEWVKQRMETVHLSLIVTQFKTGESPDLSKYRACEQGQWIRQEYFCDGRVNCAEDILPGDETEAACREGHSHTKSPALPHFPSGPPLNLLSITLILVSSTVVVFLLCLLVVRLRASRGCFSRRTSGSAECELPETVRASEVAPAQPNVYLDLSSRSLMMRGATPEAEPPPAYNDLFPAGYQFLLKAQEQEEDKTKDLSHEMSTRDERH